MAMQVIELQEWLSTFRDSEMVGIDDEGLCLRAVGDPAEYIEVGGIPEKEEETIVMLSDGEIAPILTDAVETAIEYWAAIRNIQRDNEGDVLWFDVRDWEDQSAPWVTITIDKIKAAIEKIQRREVQVSAAIINQFLGEFWDYDADGADVAVQIAAFGSIVYS